MHAVVKCEPTDIVNQDIDIDVTVKNEFNDQHIKIENIKKEINIKQELSEQDEIEWNESIHSNTNNKTTKTEPKKVLKNKNKNKKKKEEKNREREEQKNDKKIIESIHKKKKPANSNKKWTPNQDKKLLKWMRKNPNDHNNIIKITHFASSALQRTGSAVSGRIAFLKKSMKDKQKLIEQQNNNKNIKKKTMENRNNKKHKKKINKMVENEDAKKLNDILNKLHDGYCIQMNVIQSMREKMKEEKYTNIDIKDCKEITGGMSMECLRDKLDSIQHEIKKIPSHLINTKSTKKRYRNVINVDVNHLCFNVNPKKKRKLND